MKPRVVVSMLNDQQDFQRAQTEDARAGAARNGFDTEVIFAEDNAVIQIHQLFGYIHAPEAKQPTAIVVESASNEGLERVASAAAMAGIGWVITTGHAAYLEALKKAYPAVLMSCSVTNEEEIGELMVEQYRALLPAGGNLLYIEGLSGSAGNVIRKRHAEEGIRGSKIKIGKMLTADWTEVRAERTLSSWFQLKTSEAFKPDLIAAQNDAIAVGAHKAIAVHRPAWAGIPTTGCDGLPDGGQRLVREGILTATVVKPPTAGQAMDLIARYLRSERIPPFVEVSPRSYPTLEELGRKRR